MQTSLPEQEGCLRPSQEGTGRQAPITRGWQDGIWRHMEKHPVLYPTLSLKAPRDTALPPAWLGLPMGCLGMRKPLLPPAQNTSKPSGQHVCIAHLAPTTVSIPPQYQPDSLRATGDGKSPQWSWSQRRSRAAAGLSTALSCTSWGIQALKTCSGLCSQAQQQPQLSPSSKGAEQWPGTAWHHLHRAGPTTPAWEQGSRG